MCVSVETQQRAAPEPGGCMIDVGIWPSWSAGGEASAEGVLHPPMLGSR